MTTRNGILAGGNWIIDQVKIIDQYPPQDALANIIKQAANNGGAPFNLLKDLSKMLVPFDLAGIGLVGNDDNGDLIIKECENHQINTNGIQRIGETPTSYTDVMTVKSTGRRTFFHYRGANALLDRKHFNLESYQAKIFHLGYLLLLDRLDQIDENGRSEASYLLEKARELGFLTSADVVSEDSERFSKIVFPSLPYLDILFLNEYEAEKVTGIRIKQNDSINYQKVIEAGENLIDKGVNDYVFIHFPKGAIAVDKNKNHFNQGCVKIPADKIAGAVGAGDAFAAGVLFGIHEGWPVNECMKAGVITAAFSLMQPGASEGVLPYEEMLKTSADWEFENIEV